MENFEAELLSKRRLARAGFNLKESDGGTLMGRVEDKEKYIAALFALPLKVTSRIQMLDPPIVSPSFPEKAFSHLTRASSESSPFAIAFLHRVHFQMICPCNHALGQRGWIKVIKVLRVAEKVKI